MAAQPVGPVLTRLPRLVARGYPAVVPGRSSGPWFLSTSKARHIQDLMRNQFVILIGGRVHIPLTARNGRPARRVLNRARHPRPPSAPAARRASIAPAEISGSDKLSAGTSVQNEPIYVVIPLRVDRAICGMQAASRISFSCRTEPAYPPRAGPCGPPRSPPRRGGPLIPVRLPMATFPAFVCCGETTPTPSEAAFGREKLRVPR